MAAFSIRRVVLSLIAAVALMAGFAVWFWPRTREVSIDYKMPGNPGPKIAAAEAAVIERREKVVDQTVWRKEMEAEEYGRVFENFWDALNAGTNKWEVVAGLRFEGIRFGRWEAKEELGNGILRMTNDKGTNDKGMTNGGMRNDRGTTNDKRTNGEGIADGGMTNDKGANDKGSAKGEADAKGDAGALTPALSPREREKLESRYLDYYDWIRDAREWQRQGWNIMQCEFRHNAFDPQTNDVPARSRFWFSAHLTNASPARAVVEGDLVVEWKLRETNSTPAIAKIDASGLEVMFRDGPPAFNEILSETLEPAPLTGTIEPLLVYDLDGDGFPEIALPALNRIYRWRGDRYSSEKFCSTERLQILNGLFADFDGDGVTDFLYVEFDGVFLLKGAPGGKFETAPRMLTEKMDWFGPRAVTCGDVDGDGDLDVFVGQYKGPFTQGSMPTPYYDANDGYPSYLFLNDGTGKLTDATKQAGLTAKRLRRVYSASFVDLDGDGVLDLVVTSDFAGVDIYRNDGRGNFTDVTAEWLDESHAFGMGHTFGDFNNDGRLDFYMTGMTSATADRLEHLGLQRPNSKLDPAMRAKMAFGSRLYLADDRASSLRLPQKEMGVARTGWSWGVSAADFDNDGWLDLYVVNGMETMRTVHDYEGEMWLHDMFIGNSEGSGLAALIFATKGSNRRRSSESFGGFDKNRLFLNHGGREFVNVAHLLGVALENDCRNLVAADLNGDGRVDLTLTSQNSLGPATETIRVFRNALTEQGNWIAFSFRDEPGHLSPIGAQVSLKASGTKKIGAVVTGDSFRSQHPTTVRFGLGQIEKVEEVEMAWPGGAVTRISGPELNRAHWVSAPKRN